MKHATLLFAILFTCYMGFAQEEVAIEQRIEQPINTLEIYRGWDVHLLHNEADSGYRIAIVTNEDYAPFAYNVQLCNVKGDTLTILENTQLPKGTVIELEGSMSFAQIVMGIEATAQASQVIDVQSNVPKNLLISRDANFHIQHYLIPTPDDGPDIEVWDNAKLTIDTISGEGNAVVRVYDHADFQITENHLNGRITLNEYEKMPDWHYQPKDSRVIKTEEINGEWVTTNRRKIWNDVIHFDASIGYRLGTNPKNADNPLLQIGTLSVNVGMSTYFLLNYHLGLRTGIQWNTDWKSLCHQVKYEDNTLTVIDGEGDYQRNRLKNHYWGIPITLYYYIGKRQTESFSVDIFCGHLFGERLSTTYAKHTAGNLTVWDRQSIKNIHIFNPWKLEVGLSFNTNHLGFLHGFRVFTNLLPEYKPGVTDEKFRSIGIELKL